jgi:hypothetical protein
MGRHALGANMKLELTPEQIDKVVAKEMKRLREELVCYASSPHTELKEHNVLIAASLVIQSYYRVDKY